MPFMNMMWLQHNLDAICSTGMGIPVEEVYKNIVLTGDRLDI